MHTVLHFLFSIVFWYVETMSQVMHPCMSSEWYYRAMTRRLCIDIDSNSIQASFATDKWHRNHHSCLEEVLPKQQSLLQCPSKRLYHRHHFWREIHQFWEAREEKSL
jgi:hypothetical protein